MNTLNFQNILILLDKCEIISVQKGKFLKNSTEIEIAQTVNDDDSSDNAP